MHAIVEMGSLESVYLDATDARDAVITTGKSCELNYRKEGTSRYMKVSYPMRKSNVLRVMRRDCSDALDLASK